MSQPSGVAEVDRLIAVIVARDQAAWQRLVKLTPLSCSTSSSGLDRPQCQPNEAPDTPVLVIKRTLDAGNCKVHVPHMYVRAAAVPGLLNYFDLNALKLYATYSMRNAGSAPRYGVVFAAQSGSGVMGTRLQVESGQIVGIDLYCRASLDDLIADVAAQDFVLPPQFR